jgi:phosphatidylinositol alpha-mannosyltransferase
MTRLRDLDVKLVIGGSGPEERYARALARNLDVNAEFVGRVHDEELPRLYKSADVYCAPGLGGESFGIVLIEAMAAGAPVVCSDLPGFRAVAGAAALLVPPGDPGRLADALRRVLENEDESRSMSKASSQLARAYDWDRLVQNVESIYAEALEVAPTRAGSR